MSNLPVNPVPRFQPFLDETTVTRGNAEFVQRKKRKRVKNEALYERNAKRKILQTD